MDQIPCLYVALNRPQVIEKWFAGSKVTWSVGREWWARFKCGLAILVLRSDLHVTKDRQPNSPRLDLG